MAAREELGLAPDLSERAHDVSGALRRTALALEDEAANRWIDRGEVAVEELLGVVRLCGDAHALPELEHGLEDGRLVVAGADDREALVVETASGGSASACSTSPASSVTSSPSSARPAATAHV